MTTILSYTLNVGTDGNPVVVIESPLGSGQTLDPDTLRRLAACLHSIADEAEKAGPVGIEMPYRSATEY